jgi:hypothetical protein
MDETKKDLAIISTKSARKDIDTIVDMVREFLLSSRETSTAITKLQEARMWLGEELRRLADTNPYPNSKDPTNLIIDPKAN